LARKKQTDDWSNSKFVKRTIKASVFTDLFGRERFALRFYQTQHPEDTKAKESDVEIVTISNILTDNLYNDLGFMVGDKLMILAEHQAKWTVNILPRIFMYLGHSWKIFLKKRGYNVHSTTKVPLPKVELYMVYTGKRKNRPSQISLNEEFWGDKDYVVDLRIKVLYGDNKNDIVSQYVEFTHFCDEQVRLYGRTEKAIVEIFRICEERNILTEYLKERKQEVAKIMFTVFEAEEALKAYDESVAKKAEKKGMKVKAVEIAKNLLTNPILSIDYIAKSTGLSLSEVKKLAESLN